MADDRTAEPRWAQATVPMGQRQHPTGDEPARRETIGRFIVLDQLGAGGMGVVYAAYDPNLDRKVALKLLHPDARDEGSNVKTRLLREAQAMARIDHPNVIAVHEVGTFADGVYIAMELAEGGTMRGWLKQQPRNLRDVVAVFAQAGRGLAAAHAAGLVHRDFKPDNVLMTKTGTARVTDFGLVSIGDAPAPAVASEDVNARGSALSIPLTRSGAMMGTPAYMAPEQFQGGQATARTDQYAFCVALYEAIYGDRPFTGNSFEEIAQSVVGGKLVLPATPQIPSRLRRLLTRGLATDLDARYPSMDALLAELAPPPRRRAWPFALAGLLAVAGGIAAFAFGHDAAPSCTRLATERAATAWSPQARRQIHDRFVATGRSFAERASQTVDAKLDAYAGHWVQLVSDTCLAERAATAAAREPLVRRDACFEHRLDAMRAIVATLSTDVSVELVSHADEISRTLPDLADCEADPVDHPRAADAGAIAKLTVDLGNAKLHAIGGELDHVSKEAASIAAGADAIGWPPLEVRAHTFVGEVQLALEQPARKELLAAAELAFERGLDRDAAKALASAVKSAGYEGSTDGVATLAPMVRAAAGRTRDRALEIAAEISIARGMVQVDRWKDALDLCRKAHDDAEQLRDQDQLGHADDCLLEALVPMGRYKEIGPVLQRRTGDVIKQCGDDCPTLAALLDIAAEVARRQGELSEAHADAERSLAIRTAAFGPKHFEVARSLIHLADVVEAEGKPDEATRLREQALALCDESQPIQLVEIIQLRTDLAMRLAKAGEQHLREALGHFEKALELARRHYGDDSLPLAILLANYGQVKADVDLTSGLAMLQQSSEILERHRDRRARSILTMMMVVADHHDRFADAIHYGEQALAAAQADPDVRPEEIALIEHGLFRALGRTHGDLERARKLAHDARDIYARLGPSFASEVAVIDAWLATH